MSDVVGNTNRFLYPRFVGALLSGGIVALPEPKDFQQLHGWSKAGFAALVETAQRELDEHRQALDRVLSRAQVLFTTHLALFTLYIGLFTLVWNNHATCPLVAGVFYGLSGLTLLWAMLGAAAVIAVRKKFETMSAPVLARWPKFDRERYAREYAECVQAGRETVNAHVSVFGTAVRVTLLGVALLGVAWVLAQLL